MFWAIVLLQTGESVPKYL